MGFTESLTETDPAKLLDHYTDRAAKFLGTDDEWKSHTAIEVAITHGETLRRDLDEMRDRESHYADIIRELKADLAKVLAVVVRVEKSLTEHASYIRPDMTALECRDALRALIEERKGGVQ